MKRSAMKTRLPRRDWSKAILKRNQEGYCRACGHADGGYINGYVVYLELAHIIGRKHDLEVTGPRGGKKLIVLPESVAPLCGSTPERRGCHQSYDEYELDLLPYLSIEEQVQAVIDADGIALAYRRLTGQRGD